jgi:hypothetical protein
MHNHLIKFLILMGTLIVLFAGLSPQTLHAATPLPMNKGAIMAPVEAQIASPHIAQFARSTEMATSHPNTPEKGLTPTQPLGDLDPFAWDDLTAMNSSSAYAQLLVLPPYDEYRFQPDIDEEKSYVANHNPDVTESLLAEINHVTEFVLSSTVQAELGIECAACHGVSNLANEKTKIVNGGQFMQTLSPSGTAIACDQCHLQKIQQVSWQFRGVE